jgi:hypothetical protein
VTMRQRKMLTHQPPIVADVCRKANLRLTKRFHRLEARGKRSPVAITAIARELAGFIWPLHVSTRPDRPQHPEQTQNL